MEKESGIQLDWYFDEWINSVRSLDYAVVEVRGHNDSTTITLARKGEMLMPVDVGVTGVDGVTALHHIPLSLMLGTKREGVDSVEAPWLWVAPTYSFTVPRALSTLAAVTVDPSGRTPDVDTANDQVTLGAGAQGTVRP